MIDSGSQGNIIKAEVLPHDVKINFLDKIQIKGISNEILVTVGSTKLKVFNEVIKFHVIRNEIQIPYDGILGVEFLNSLYLLNKAITMMIIMKSIELLVSTYIAVSNRYRLSTL